MSILMTNNEKYRMEAYKEQLKVFDKVICSYQVGFLKPDKPMFDLIVREANCKKNEILFCDDKKEFIEIAGN